jgi:hypothetical protein
MVLIANRKEVSFGVKPGVWLGLEGLLFGRGLLRVARHWRPSLAADNRGVFAHGPNSLRLVAVIVKNRSVLRRTLHNSNVGVQLSVSRLGNLGALVFASLVDGEVVVSLLLLN